MLFSIHCPDYENNLQTRLDNYDAHRTYLDNTSTPVVIAGPITADDGETPVGSIFIIDAKDRAEAERFNQADPFYQANVWDRNLIRINPFNKRRGWLEGY